MMIKTRQAARLDTAPASEEIAQRAFEIYLARGCGPGEDLNDWLQAEQELKEHAESTGEGHREPISDAIR